MRLVTVLWRRYGSVFPKLIPNPDNANSVMFLIDDSEGFGEVLHSFEGNVSLSGHDCFGKEVSGSDSTFGCAFGSVKSSDVAVNRDVGIVLSEYILSILIDFYQLFDCETI